MIECDSHLLMILLQNRNVVSVPHAYRPKQELAGQSRARVHEVQRLHRVAACEACDGGEQMRVAKRLAALRTHFAAVMDSTCYA